MDYTWIQTFISWAHGGLTVGSQTIESALGKEKEAHGMTGGGQEELAVVSNATRLIPPQLASMQAMVHQLGASVVPSCEPLLVYASSWTCVNEAFWLLRGQLGTVEPILFCGILRPAEFMRAPFSRPCRRYKSYYRYITFPVTLEHLIETIVGMKRMNCEDHARFHWDLFGDPDGLMNRIRHDVQRVVQRKPLDEAGLMKLEPVMRPLLEEILGLARVSNLAHTEAASCASTLLDTWCPANFLQFMAVLRIEL